MRSRSSRSSRAAPGGIARREDLYANCNRERLAPIGNRTLARSADHGDGVSVSSNRINKGLEPRGRNYPPPSSDCRRCSPHRTSYIQIRDIERRRPASRRAEHFPPAALGRRVYFTQYRVIRRSPFLISLPSATSNESARPKSTLEPDLDITSPLLKPGFSPLAALSAVSF